MTKEEKDSLYEAIMRELSPIVKNKISQMSNAILANGFVSDKDLQIPIDDSLGKNMLNAYLLGAHIASNLVDIDYMTPYTAKNRTPRV